MNLPNYLTLSRLLISPLFMLFYLERDFFGLSAQSLPVVLLILIAISELSDFLDGYFARRWNQITPLGKILDPVADTITHLTAFLSFTEAPIRLPIWLVFIFLYRDIVVSTLRTLCALQGHALAARSSGKLKAVLQGLTICAILVMMLLEAHGYMSLSLMQQLSTVFASVTALYTLTSCIDYIYANRSYYLHLHNLKN